MTLSSFFFFFFLINLFRRYVHSVNSSGRTRVGSQSSNQGRRPEQNQDSIHQLCRDRSRSGVGFPPCGLPKRVLLCRSAAGAPRVSAARVHHSEPTLGSHSEERICQQLQGCFGGEVEGHGFPNLELTHILWVLTPILNLNIKSWQDPIS